MNMKIKISRVICQNHNECNNNECWHKLKHPTEDCFDSKYYFRKGFCPFEEGGVSTRDIKYPKCIDASREATFIQAFRESHEGLNAFFTVGHIVDTTRRFYWTIIEKYWIAIVDALAWPQHSIRDGYWLTLLSPIILAYWAICSIIGAFFGLLLLLPYLLIIATYIPSSIWALLIEAPADFTNKNNKENNKQ